MADHPSESQATFARMASIARRARRLPVSSWTTLARVLPLLALVRVALWTLPYRVVAHLFDVNSEDIVVRPKEDPKKATALVRTVAWAGRTLLADRPCLTQALACRWLLARRGYDADLKLGVRRSEDGSGIVAHAWLEMDGRVILGGGDSAESYASFVPSRRASVEDQVLEEAR